MSRPNPESGRRRLAARVPAAPQTAAARTEGVTTP